MEVAAAEGVGRDLAAADLDWDGPAVVTPGAAELVGPPGEVKVEVRLAEDLAWGIESHRTREAPPS